jgi:hypothetical protein
MDWGHGRGDRTTKRGRLAMKRMVLGGLVLGTLMLGMCSASALAGSDPGWWASHSSEEQHAIVDYVYERSGHATVPYSGDAQALAETISQRAIDSGSHEFPLAPELGGEEFSAVESVGLLSRIADVIPEVALGVATFGAGVAIGTGARKLFVELTAPDDAASGGTWTWNELNWEPYGTEIFFGAKVQQRPGAYVYNAGYAGSSFPIARWFEEPCEFSGFEPPTGARLQAHVSTSALCGVFDFGSLSWHYYPVYVDYPYLLLTDLHPVLPLRPFNAETDLPDATVTTPPDPGAEAVESSLEALDGEGYELMRDQLDFALTPGAQEEEEPVRSDVALREEDRRCKEYFGDRPGSDPGARAPGAEGRAADWDYDMDSFEEVYNPLTRSNQTVKLRWGTTKWGYRHIVIGHGWNAEAAERTSLALLTDTEPEPNPRDPGRDSFLYYYNVPSLPGGMHCRQRVSVSYRRDSIVPVARHIITSFIEAY